MRALGDTRTPSVSTTWPSTFTQPLSIQRSASRREHRPSSPMRLERRGSSAFSGDVGGRVMQKNRIVVSSQGTIFSPRAGRTVRPALDSTDNREKDAPDEAD